MILKAQVTVPFLGYEYLDSIDICDALDMPVN